MIGRRTARAWVATVGVLAGLAAAPGCSAPASSNGAAWFEDVGDRDGLVFTYRSGQVRDIRLFPEIIGGGAALFDMDGDGDLDAYLVQGGSVRGQADADARDRLFENRGDGTFADVTVANGLHDTGYGMGVAAGDYDDDGDVDLYVTNYGRNALLENDGRGRFADVAARAGVDRAGWGSSAAFLDYDADGDLDLFVANYVNWTPETEQDCYNLAGMRDYCMPINYNAPAMDTLYRNDGGGSFTDVTVEVGLDAAFGNGLGVVASDFDANGRLDVFVANDTMVNQLWMGQREGRFVDEALLRGCAVDEHGLAKAGMGVVAQDVDDDADEDLLVVNITGQTDSLFLNEAGMFRDRTGERGLGSVPRAFTRFGVGMHDFDNDGLADLYEANGRVTLALEPPTDDPFAEENLLLRGTPGGRFEEVLPRGGTARPLIATSRGAAFGDVDGDGGLDILVVNRDSPAHLLRNVVPRRGHWLRVRALERSGRDALGAVVTLEIGERRVTRTVRAAYSYCSSSDPAIHVGLGRAQRVDRIRVRWVDGAEADFGAHEADRTVVLEREPG